MSRGIVLSLCDRTGNMVRPWLLAGYECWIVDIQHPPGKTQDGNLVRVGADVLNWMPPRYDYAMVFAFPPCTHLAVSGSRHFASKGLRVASEALALVDRCREICEWSGAPWMLENPVGVLSTYWRKPDYTFNPYEYAGYLPPAEQAAESYTKKTCLWVGGGFRMPVISPVGRHDGSIMHHRVRCADKRSVTPRGFAQAVYERNCVAGGFIGNRTLDVIGL